jgi:hypothetical protein
MSDHSAFSDALIEKRFQKKQREEEMETMMENHLYESHREEWAKLPRF